MLSSAISKPAGHIPIELSTVLTTDATVNLDATSDSTATNDVDENTAASISTPEASVKSDSPSVPHSVVASEDTPLGHPEADVIIRSSDDIEFRMFKLDLGRSSPVFAGMIASLPPALSDASESDADVLPSIRVDEKRDQLNIFLPFCKFGVRPTLTSFDEISLAMKMAKKYKMEGVKDAAEAALITMASDEPVRAFALAWRYKMEGPARQAAQLCLRKPASSIVTTQLTELTHINAEALRSLLDYRYTCSEAALTVLASWTSVIDDRESTWQCRYCRYSSNGVSYSAAPWWTDFVASLQKNLDQCTWEGVVREIDLLSCFVRKPCALGCNHTAIVPHAQSHLQKMRTRIAKAIEKVSPHANCRSVLLTTSFFRDSPMVESGRTRFSLQRVCAVMVCKDTPKHLHAYLK